MTRSIAGQTVEELGGPGSVLVRQRNDHVELDRLLRELDGSKGRAQEQVLRRIGPLVFSHAFAEETVLWPVLRRTLADGDALTLGVEKEHQEVNELASELDTLGHDDPAAASDCPGWSRCSGRTSGTRRMCSFRGCRRSWTRTSCGGLAGSGSWRAGPRRPGRTPRCPVVRPATSSPACRCRCWTAPATSWTEAWTGPRSGWCQPGGPSVAAWPRLPAWSSGCLPRGRGTGHPPTADLGAEDGVPPTRVPPADAKRPPGSSRLPVLEGCQDHSRFRPVWWAGTETNQHGGMHIPRHGIVTCGKRHG